MYKKIAVAFVLSFFLTVIFGFLFIPILKRIKAGQPVLKYVKEHKDKEGTPTMGGLFFITASAVSFFVFCGTQKRVAVYCLILCLSFTVVGFLDDFLKIRLKKNEGLKPYQKIIFQGVVSVVAGIYAYKNSITFSYIPFTDKMVNYGAFTLFFVPFIFVAITNSVNLTDGLDGLCGGVSLIYLASLSVLILLQKGRLDAVNLSESESENALLLCFCFMGGLLGFLAFNTNKASVFMGDTGSLALGGLLGALSIFTFNSLYIPIIGITFVFSTVSVIIQVVHYKRTGRRVFLMSPFHHHLQKKGLSESKITFIYCAVTVITGVISVIFYI